LNIGFLLATKQPKYIAALAIWNWEHHPLVKELKGDARKFGKAREEKGMGISFHLRNLVRLSN